MVYLRVGRWGFIKGGDFILDRFYYAILDDYICIGIIDTFSEIKKDNYIPLREYNESIIGMKWDGKNWIEV